MSTAAAGKGTDDEGKKEKGMLNVIDFGARGDG